MFTPPPTLFIPFLTIIILPLFASASPLSYRARSPPPIWATILSFPTANCTGSSNTLLIPSKSCFVLSGHNYLGDGPGGQASFMFADEYVLLEGCEVKGFEDDVCGKGKGEEGGREVLKIFGSGAARDSTCWMAGEGEEGVLVGSLGMECGEGRGEL